MKSVGRLECVLKIRNTIEGHCLQAVCVLGLSQEVVKHFPYARQRLIKRPDPILKGCAFGYARQMEPIRPGDQVFWLAIKVLKKALRFMCSISLRSVLGEVLFYVELIKEGNDLLGLYTKNLCDTGYG